MPMSQAEMARRVTPGSREHLQMMQREWECHDLWDDLRFPAQGITIGGLSVPPTQATDTGLLEFTEAGGNQTIGILAQLPHAWKEGSSIVPHIHWRKNADDAGDVLWTLRYKWFNNGDLEGNWSGLINGTLAVDPGATQAAAITTFGEIDGSGMRVSSLFLCQLGRLPGNAADTATADATLYEFDIHYLTDSPGGSYYEFTKQEGY